MLLDKSKGKDEVLSDIIPLQTNEIEYFSLILEKPTFFPENSLENQHRIRNMKDKELVRSLKQ